MPETYQNLTVWAGDTLDIVFPVKTPEGADLPLDGAVVTWRLARTVKSTGADVLLVKNSPASGLTIEGSVCTCRIAAGDIGNALAGTHYHEARVTFPDGRSYLALSGQMIVQLTLPL